MPEPEKRSDKFTWTYALWLLPFLAQNWLYWLQPQWDWWTISLIIWVLTLIAVAGSLCINLAQRRWRRLVSLLIAPLLLLVLLRILAAVGITSDSVRFALTKQMYLAEIERADRSGGEPRFKTFAWDNTFLEKTYSTLVYDESDEIALPRGEQSTAWQQRVQTPCSEKKECVDLDPGPDEYVSVRKIGEHFYILDNYLPNAFP
ncbi:hypothetical protein ELH53_04020 [Rhizobium ruizarguesonis]|uniref:hypothetical protein n=1 Tax=Rhizobium ruizarguesonis TaxID=2081791 RepID=UPI001032006F|nr:hypothetical protein [Rhizobium ruizarguesonis]TBA84246.1 hypothetical protein ELH53_04020 [Rhizobium ruizarguesonis]TBB10373.1 hypothetical protein ELH50_04275 [Rhizobium ruizarguesonis]TBC28398.1 hypothetical protein ELH35_04085 [Rhizobium ruizarguesonis]